MALFGLPRRWSDRSGDSDSVDAAPASASAAPGVLARADLLERISEFLLRNALEISPRNLLIAHAAFSGSSLGLARKIAIAQTAGQITQEWLDEAVADDPELAVQGDKAVVTI